MDSYNPMALAFNPDINNAASAGRRVGQIINQQAGNSPQASRIAQAFQPPAQPFFTRPENQFSPLLEGVKQPLTAQGGPSGPPAPQKKPSGPIIMSQPSPPVAAAPTFGNGAEVNPTHNENPWIRPDILSAMANGGSSKPGDGVWSFLNSGAAHAFKNQALQGPTPNGPTLDTVANGSGGLYAPGQTATPSKGALGEPGSPMSLLTGGDLDPKSPLAALSKLFTGGFF